MNRREKQNLIISITAVVGVVLIAIVGWYMSKEYRFKKYHNERGGFSISYPATWSVEENVEGAAAIFYSPKHNELDVFKESVNVVIQDLSKKPMKLRAYTELAIKQMDAVFGDNMLVVESGSTFVSGQSGHKFVFIGKGPETDLQYMSVWTIKGLKAYQITYTALASQYERYLIEVKRMLGSFRLE